MTKNSDSETEKLLKSIDGKLETLITLTKLIIPKHKPTEEEKKIFELCNKKNTASDMVRITKKTRNAVDIILTNLRGKVLIKSVTLNEKDPSTGKHKVVYGKV